MGVPVIIRPINILLVEDNPGDAVLTREALAEGKVLCNLATVADGVEALAYLRRQGPYGDAPRPDLILLDLNLPRKNGREVLEEIKADPALQMIPVALLTNLDPSDELLTRFKLDAACYVPKPVDLNRFVSVVRTIGDFWFTVVKLPAD